MTKYSYVYIRVYVIRDSSSRLKVAFNKWDLQLYTIKKLMQYKVFIIIILLI